MRNLFAVLGAALILCCGLLPAQSQNQLNYPGATGGVAPGMVQMCLDANGHAVAVTVNNNPCPVGSDGGGGGGLSYFYAPSTLPVSSIVRPANTTTYTANTGWCHAASGCTSVFSFANACRANGGEIIITGIDLWSSNNPAVKLAGMLYIFNATPATVIADDATFTIAAADYANLTGQFDGIPFTLVNQQAAGAANSGVSLTTNLRARCAAAATQLFGMVEVLNAYVPANGETLTINLHTVGVN